MIITLIIVPTSESAACCHADTARMCPHTVLYLSLALSSLCVDASLFQLMCGAESRRRRQERCSLSTNSRTPSFYAICSIRSQVSKVYLGSCVQLYSLAETPQLLPSPAFGLIYEGAIGQQRQTTSLCDPLSYAIHYFVLPGSSHNPNESDQKEVLRPCY